MRSRTVVLMTGLLLMMGATGASAFQAYLKLDGIAGESTAVAHAGEIDVLSFSFGESNEGVVAYGGGGGAGKAKIQDLQIEKRMDAASLPLYLACLTGKHFPNARLTLAKGADATSIFLTLQLTDVMISSCTASGKAQGGDIPTEQVVLTASKINWEYRPQRPDGTLAPAIKGGWDVKANTVTEAPAPVPATATANTASTRLKRLNDVLHDVIK